MHYRFSTSIAICTLALAGCGSPTQTPPSKAPQKLQPQEPDQWTAVVASRNAALPPATATTGQVVFLRAGSVWRMGPDGGNLEQLTVRGLDAPDESPRLSPDGSLLIYTGTKEGSSQIYLQSMEELIPSPLTSGNDSQASWSPDGSQIVFMRGDARVNRDLFITSIDGESEPILLLQGDDDHPQLAGEPIWSSDGKSIFFSADRRLQQGTGLWRIDIASRTLQPITQSPKDMNWSVDHSANLSPDGKSIVFASNRHSSSSDTAEDFDIYTMNLDGSRLTRLTNDMGTIANPVFSNDGTRIYFASTSLRASGFEWEIFVMAATGGKQRRLSRDEHPENSSPFVAPVHESEL